MRNMIYGAVVFGLLLPCARADEWNKKMVVTVKQRVQVPGKILEPGAYVFRLQDSPSNRNIVQIYNHAENHLIQTALAIPDYRLKPASGVTIQLEERAAGEPDAIKALFFPGDNYGEEFVYPPAAQQTAVVVTSRPLMAAAKPAPPPAPAPAPAPQAKAAPPPPTPPPAAPAQVAQVPQPLPRTASNQPLLALLGLLSLAAAFGLRALRRKTS